jgi:hypothetical protein
MAWMSCAVFPKARLVTLALLLFTALAQAQIAATNKISDVRGTKHNLSAAGDGSATPSGGTVPERAVKATSETQVCVFCHTPHEATSGIVAPLWNRKLSGATYTPYTSSSLEADAAQLAAAPGGSSKLCLSCHDGTMAIDKVNVLNGIKNATIAMTGTTAGKMPIANAGTGFTRNLGLDLSNDHPISFTYDSTLAGRDGELRSPDGALVGNRVRGATPPKLPLENNQMQCATCHDPHLRDKTASNGNAKFLRMNRFQVTQPTGGAFSAASDTICLACHDKAGASWAFSAHANSQVATQPYKDAAAQLREFPLNAQVWQVGCLNCHDTHSVQGSRRLLREGVDNKTGGSAALEETCFQCHANVAESAVVYPANNVKSIPDIKSDFNNSTFRRMPIKSADQQAGTEVHDIGGVFNDGPNADCSKIAGKCGKDLLESRAKLGLGNLNNRHAECSDCHNPHRVIKGQDGLPGILSPSNTNQKAGTHRHEDAAGYVHSNTISGVLRGSTGVEPVYINNSFQVKPSDFNVKRGDPGADVNKLASSPFVTREYQICLKCHSNNGYADTDTYPNDLARPQLGGAGLTPANANGHSNFTSYTNQAKEFQAPTAHRVQIGSVSVGTDGGAGTVAASNTNNHRSWHPVMAPTGRTLRPASGFLLPWSNAVGTQTMYCSDCHGSATAGATAMPNNNTATDESGFPWGPHGSENNFLLKGDYSTNTGEGQEATGLCFKCHKYSNYATDATEGSNGATGFNTTDKGDGHALHSKRIGKPIRCNWCHVAVPHGWKNRGLLVNLKDVGPEAGLTAPTLVIPAKNVGYTNGPYYRKSFLRVDSFPSGSNWSEGNCNGGKDGMRNTCDSPN